MKEATDLTLGLYGYDARRPTVGCRHNSGVALVNEQGAVCFAVEEERLNRIKNASTYPLLSLAMAQARCGRPSQAAIAGWPRHRYFREAQGNYRRWQKASRGATWRHFANCYLDFSIHTLGAAAMRLPSLPANLGHLHRQCIRHHHAHAATAYYCAPWKDAPTLVITLDGAGDGESGSVWLGANGKLEKLASVPHPDSIGAIYSLVTAQLGFQPNRHEGKVLGLAAHGQDVSLGEQLLKHAHVVAGIPRFDAPLLRLSYNRFAEATWQEMSASLHREDVAAGVQYFTEIMVLRMVRYWVEKTGVRHLAVAGGVFANVKLNQRIMALDEVENLYIYPNMGDGGLAAGAALAVVAARNGSLMPRFLDHVYLGPTITASEAEAALREAGLKAQRPANMAADVAALLADGKVVARAAGCMEYGPRALGNRTLFAACNDPSINQWLNQKLQRTEFMPFAPIIMEEHAKAYFPDWRPEHIAARFMTITYDASALAKKNIPAAIHVDGTARPQVLRQQDNPEVHAILSAYYARTGVPALINTSFNMHEEPIVCTAADAVRAFQLGHLDALICADYLCRL